MMDQIKYRKKAQLIKENKKVFKEKNVKILFKIHRRSNKYDLIIHKLM